MGIIGHKKKKYREAEAEKRRMPREENAEN